MGTFHLDVDEEGANRSPPPHSGILQRSFRFLSTIMFNSASFVSEHQIDSKVGLQRYLP